MNNLAVKYPILSASYYREHAAAPFALFAFLSVVVWIVYKYHQFLIRSICLLLQIFAPFGLIVSLHAMWLASEQPARPSALAPSQSGGGRILWVIFDAMGQQLAMEDRPQWLKLPEFERFQKESIVAKAAFPPGVDTISSMPSLILGKRIAAQRWTPQREFEIKFDGEHTRYPLSKHQNFFRRARQTNRNTSVIGWHIPYCSVFLQDLTRCRFLPSNRMVYPDRLIETAEIVLRRSLVPHWTALEMLVETHRILESLVSQEISHPHADVLLFHFPVPHPPGPVPEGHNSYSIQAYYKNLEFSDRLLGEIRRNLESRKEWENSTVLVSADHQPSFWGWKENTNDPRVPFLLKLPRQRERASIEFKFNTVLTGDLLLEIMAQNLLSSKDVVQWLEKRAAASKPEHLVSTIIEAQESPVVTR